MKRILTLVAVWVLSIASASEAYLIDRGAGLIYDTDLNVTWLQDANYSQTSGYDSDGRMTASQATDWVRSLVYYDVRGVALTGWRLPSPMNLDGSGPTVGYNVNTEMGHLWHYELGNNQDDFWQDLKTGPFINVEKGNSFYWLQGNYTFHFGQPNCYLTANQYSEDLLSVWPVRDGDVAPVPIPGSFLLFGSGLAGIIGFIKLKGNRRA